MRLKEVVGNIRESHRRYGSSFINFTKGDTYYESSYPTEHTVYQCYWDGRLKLIDSQYAKSFMKKKKEYESWRAKKRKRKR